MHKAAAGTIASPAGTELTISLKVTGQHAGGRQERRSVGPPNHTLVIPVGSVP
jgi:hypothetical protein